MKKTYFLLLVLGMILINVALPAQEIVLEQTYNYPGGKLFEFVEHDNTFFALSVAGVIRSEDGGENWELVLPLPFDQAFHNNTVSYKLAANDSIVFVAYKELIADELTDFLKKSIDNGNSWVNVPLPEGSSLGEIDVNDKFLYSYDSFLSLVDTAAAFQPRQEPYITSRNYHYQNEYLFIYNEDSIFFSTDNIDWIYKPMPVTPPCSNPKELAIIGQELYVSIYCNLFKSALTNDVNYTTLDNNYVSGRIASEGDYLYYKRAGLFLEINTITLDTSWIEGSNFGLFDEIFFTDDWVLIDNKTLAETTYDEVNYYPIIRFDRFSDVEIEDIKLLRSSFNTENTYRLVFSNAQLFSCNVQGLHQYDEASNTWHFITTPFYYGVTNLFWHNGYYYLTDTYNVYRTIDFELWENILSASSINHLQAYGNDLLCFGFTTLYAYNETDGVRFINELEDFGNGGTYPRHYPLHPPAICNDTLVVSSGGDLFFSSDGGENWNLYFYSLYSNPGFIEGGKTYYFKKYFNENANISFAKNSKGEEVGLNDYEDIYNGIFINSQANYSYYHFLKSDNLLFYSLPGVGVTYSNDDGATWQLLSNELPLLYVTSMEATDDYIFFAAMQNGITRLRKDLLTHSNAINGRVEVELYPNPTQAILHFGEDYSGVIYDSTGRNVLTFSNCNKVSTENLPSGLYYLKFKGSRSAQTFIKN